MFLSCFLTHCFINKFEEKVFVYKKIYKKILLENSEP